MKEKLEKVLFPMLSEKLFSLNIYSIFYAKKKQQNPTLAW